MLSRDYRFDGKFFVGVKTTGIYCRPICPAKPKRENVLFFQNALDAEQAGFRPCLRCHPEFSPETFAWPGKSEIVKKALNLISQNVMFETDIANFARQLGITDRQLRRLFDKEVGLSPKKVSDLHRLNFAKKLITETSLSLTKVAMSAGFASVRRFNDAFKKRYNKAPRFMRKTKSDSKKDAYTLHIAYRPPFDWTTLLQYYEKHLIPYLEKVTKNSYQRVFKIGSTYGSFTVLNDEENARLELKVHCSDPNVLFAVVNRVRKMFDLDSDPLLIHHQFSKIPYLNQLWEEFPGLRIAQGWDPFEIAVGTILGQVVSVKQASKLMGDLVCQYGEEIVHPITSEKSYLFPTPETLLNASFNQIKTTNQRKNTIKMICQSLINGEINFSEHQNYESLKTNLQKIKGLGNWSAEYILLRALGDTNAFPKDDLLLKRALQLHKEIDLNLVEPWKGYLAVLLWKKYAVILSKQRIKNENIKI